MVEETYRLSWCGALRTYLALSFTPRICVHSAVIANETATDTCSSKLLGNDLSVFLSPHIDDNTTFAEAAFLDRKFFGAGGFTFLFLQNFV